MFCKIYEVLFYGKIVFYYKIFMMKNNEVKKNILNLFDYALISLFSCGLTCIFYKIFYGKIDYENLRDFFVGTSIYANTNKLLDLWIVFVYVALFFIVLGLYKYLIKPFFNFEFNLNFELPKIDFGEIIQKHKSKIFIFEIFTSFLYVFMHPLNGHFYLPVAIIVGLFILFSIYLSYKNLYKSEKPSLSVFALIPIAILLFGQGYNTGYNVGIDNHHSGEQIAVFFQHYAFGLKYYKDVMLVHGFLDVVPSFLGLVLFGENTLYTSLLGRSFFDNSIVILTVIFGYYVFKKCPVFLSFSMFRAYNIPQLYVLTYLLMLKKSFLQNPFVWLIAYILLSFSLLFFWTTYGTFWLVATLPLAVYVLLNLKNENKFVLKYLLISLFAGLVLFCNRELIFNYSMQATNYIQSNLYAFGNGFPPIKFHQIFSDLIKLFALVVVPYFLIKLVEEIKNPNKNVQYLFALLFSIIFVCVSLEYSLGRIDFIAMQRIKDISMAYLGVIVPYLLLQKNSKYLNILKFLAIGFAVFVVFSSLPNLNRWLPEKHLKKNIISENIGEFYFSKDFETNIAEIKPVLDKYSKSENDFLDINYGMNYFYFNKKLQIPFVSYYNVVNSKQNKECVEFLQKNMPNVILISTDFQNYFDEIYPSLRINAIYRALLLSRKYNLLTTGSNTFLIKSSSSKFSKSDLKILDEKLANSNIGYLPDAWGNSINSLPIKNFEIPHKINYDKNKIIITFNKPQNGKNIDLIAFKSSISENSYNININGRSSTLKFNSKQNQILFPFDNFPSWLLNDRITQITIETDKPTQITDLKFYKRNL